jgi:putative transposase
MRVEADRRTLRLPVIGPLRSKENTRRLERLVRVGRAKVLSATLSAPWGRLFVSFSCIVQKHEHAPALKKRAGVDLGLRCLATVADTDSDVFEVPNPAPLRKSLLERRKVGRQLSRRIPGSHGHREAKAKLAKLDRRCVHLRQQASHQLVCAQTGELVDRDINAALNLRDWPEDKLASYSSVGAVAPLACNSDDGQDARSLGAVGGHVRPCLLPRPCPTRPGPAREPR